MKKILVFLLIIFCACSYQKENFKDFVQGSFLIKHGEQLIQDNEYELVYTNWNKNINELSIEVYYNTYDKNSLRQSLVYKLNKIDSNHFKTKIKILPNTSWIAIYTSSPKSISHDQVYIPVYRKHNQKEIGANEPLILKSNKETYLNYFYDEINNYPNNIAIYATRWSRETDLGIDNKDSVLLQINKLEKSNADPNILPLLQVIAYQISYDSLKYENAIQATKNIKASPFLNNWSIDAFISNMYMTKDRNKIIENVIQNNQFSFLGERAIQIYDLDPKVKINLINSYVSKYPNIPYYQLFRGLVLSQDFISDSTEQVKFIINELTTILTKYDSDNELYYNNGDPGKSFYIARRILQNIEHNLATYTKDYNQAIDYYKKTIKLYDNSRKNTAMTYSDLSKFYIITQQLDSAIKYQYYSYLLFPENKGAKAKLDSLLVKSKEGKSLKDLEKKYSFPTEQKDCIFGSNELPAYDSKTGKYINK